MNIRFLLIPLLFFLIFCPSVQSAVRGEELSPVDAQLRAEFLNAEYPDLSDIICDQGGEVSFARLCEFHEMFDDDCSRVLEMLEGGKFNYSDSVLKERALSMCRQARALAEVTKNFVNVYLEGQEMSGQVRELHESKRQLKGIFDTLLNAFVQSAQDYEPSAQDCEFNNVIRDALILSTQSTDQSLNETEKCERSMWWGRWLLRVGELVLGGVACAKFFLGAETFRYLTSFYLPKFLWEHDHGMIQFIAAILPLLVIQIFLILVKMGLEARNIEQSNESEFELRSILEKLGTLVGRAEALEQLHS